MNNIEFLNELLNLEKLQVAEAEFAGAEQVTLFVKSELSAAICPNCNQVSTKVHDLSATQMIRDLSIGERRCYLSYPARRFDCEHCNKTFVERVDWKRPGVSYTLRYEKYIYQRACKEPVVKLPKMKVSAKRRYRPSSSSGQKNACGTGVPTSQGDLSR